MLKRLATWSVLAAALVALCSAGANAQSTTGSISGVISDSSGGGVLPGADVVVVHDGTGLERHAVSDATGFYRVLNLNPGQYRVTASLSGFNKRSADRLLVSVSRDLRVDLEMTVGNIGDTVEV